MKRSLPYLFLTAVLLSGCSKDNTQSDKGSATIDNRTYQSTTYYVYGFSFPKARKVPTTQTPGPDIIIYVNSDTPPARLTLQANNLTPSFYKVGDYADAAAASAAFDGLKTVGTYTWTDMADPVAENQVWVYKSGTETYAKIRIISTVNEVRNSLPYGECTFEWVYQPDGSKTFPE
jgi:hypothetical protein